MSVGNPMGVGLRTSASTAAAYGLFASIALCAGLAVAQAPAINPGPDVQMIEGLANKVNEVTTTLEHCRNACINDSNERAADFVASAYTALDKTKEALSNAAGLLGVNCGSQDGDDDYRDGGPGGDNIDSDLSHYTTDRAS